MSLVTCRTLYLWLILPCCCLKILLKGDADPGLHPAAYGTSVKCFFLGILLSFFKLIQAKLYWENAREHDKKQGQGVEEKLKPQKQDASLKKITFKKGFLPNCSMSFTWSVDCIQGSSFSFFNKLIKINLAWLLCQLSTVSDNSSFRKCLTPLKAKPQELTSLHPRGNLFQRWKPGAHFESKILTLQLYVKGDFSASKQA